MSANIRQPDDPPIEPSRHELRFTLTDSMRDEFAERARTGFASTPRRIYSIYYDTPSGSLWRQGIALRVRAVDGGYLQTVKVRAPRPEASCDGVRAQRIPADPFDGLKWERVTLTPLPEAAALPPQSSPVGAVIRDFLPLLQPAFETDVQRQVRIVVPEEGVRFELASDIGVIRAGGGLVATIGEVELSQQAGPDSIFHRYALQWARLHRASLLTDTRHARGMALSGFPPSDLFPAPRPRSLPDGAVDAWTAARSIVGARLEQFVEHLPAALESPLPRGPHQLRTALRRLRAAIRFFDLREDRFRAHDQPWRAIDRTAAELLGATGALCQCDRVLLGLLPVLDEAFPEDPALAQLGSALDSYREACLRQLRQHLQAPATTEFVLLTAAALGTLGDCPVERVPQGTRLGAIASTPPSTDASGRPAANAVAVVVAADRRAADIDPTTGSDKPAGSVTSIFDSSPGGVTVWADAPPADRQAAPRFDSWSAQRLNQLATRLYQQVGDAGINDDWTAVRAGLRQLRLALKVAQRVAPDKARPQRLLRRLRQWEYRLASDGHIETTRQTVQQALRGAQAPDAMAARVLGLIDGHWAFARQRRSGAEQAETRRRQALKWRDPQDQATTLIDAEREDEANALLQALHRDALGPVSQSRRLRKLLRQHFELDPDATQPAAGEGPRPQPHGLSAQLPARVRGPRQDNATAFSPVAARLAGWSDGDRVIDLTGHGRPPRSVSELLITERLPRADSVHDEAFSDDADPDDEDLDLDLDLDLSARQPPASARRSPPASGTPGKPDLH